MTRAVPGRGYFFRYRPLTRGGAGDWREGVSLLVA